MHAVSIPDDELMLSGYFGFLASIAYQSYPASNLLTRQRLAWEPTGPACSTASTTATTSRPPERNRTPTHGETMMTISIIGSGQIGSSLARLAVDARHYVVLSNSRGPHSLHDVIAALGPRASAATSWVASTETWSHRPL